MTGVGDEVQIMDKDGKMRKVKITNIYKPDRVHGFKAEDVK